MTESKQRIITCPNPKCAARIPVDKDRTEIMCHKCGVTIDLHDLEKDGSHD